MLVFFALAFQRYLNATRVHVPGAVFADGSDVAKATTAAAKADLVLLCLGLGQLESEGTDRAYLGYPPEQLALWKAVRSAAKPGAKLVLISVSGGGVAFNATVEGMMDAMIHAGCKSISTPAALHPCLCNPTR